MRGPPGVIFPFRSTFAIKYFQHAHGLSLEDAGALNGWVFFAAIFATPAFGLLVDKIGKRSFLMAGGSLLLLAVFPILDFTHMHLWVSTVLIGIAFSLVPAVLWPSVPYLVEPKRLGTAFGLMTLLQNIGSLSPPAARLMLVNHGRWRTPSPDPAGGGRTPKRNSRARPRSLVAMAHRGPNRERGVALDGASDVIMRPAMDVCPELMAHLYF